MGKDEFEIRKSQNLDASLRNKILSFATMGISLRFNEATIHSYKIVKHTVHQFCLDTDATYLNKMINQQGYKELETAIHKGKAVYMIVGLKVSYKTTVTHQTGRKQDFKAEADIPVDSTGEQVR